MIESTSNGQYKRIRKLMRQSKARQGEKVFVAEGIKILREASERGLLQSVYVSESLWESETSIPLDDAIPVEVIRDHIFTQLSDTVHPQGVLGIVKMPEYDRDCMMQDPDAKLLCLEDVRDPGNMGTMIRTAEGAGMSGIILSSSCVDIYNPKVVRATMGSLLRVPYYICDDLPSEITKLQAEGVCFYAAHLGGSRLYYDVSYEGRIGILIGNEAHGLSDGVADQADELIKIPMQGKLESLNAAVSAALIMYEATRRQGD